MSEIYELGWTENIIAKRELLPECQGVFGKLSKAWVSGKVEGNFEYSQHVCGRNYYEIKVGCLRQSGTKDVIPVIVPEELISANIVKEEVNGKFVEVGGELRSHDSRGTDGKRHLKVYLFAKYINICDDVKNLKEGVDLNLVYLEGHICVKPIFRETPLGRKITDFIIKITEINHKDYIPAIAWGAQACEASYYKVANKVSVYGRIQSRQYFKRNPENPEQVEIKEAYEVSIMNLKLLK